MLSAAFVTDDLVEIIETGLSEIPDNSRLSEAVRDVMNWREEYDNWQEVWDRVMEKYGNYHPVHTINNAAIVILGLLYGGGDFERSISLSVMGGNDTDCNGATAGSIVGAILGADALPGKWIDPMNDRVKSIVVGFTDSRISDLAKRTCIIREKIYEKHS
jgi:ADP-ribosylglycohydrolase